MKTELEAFKEATASPCCGQHCWHLRPASDCRAYGTDRKLENACCRCPATKAAR